MHSVLLIVSVPMRNAIDEEGKRGYFLEDMKTLLPRYSEIEILGENCWLIPLNKGAQCLSVIVSTASNRGLNHRALFFQEPPEWVSSYPAP